MNAGICVCGRWLVFLLIMKVPVGSCGSTIGEEQLTFIAQHVTYMYVWGIIVGDKEKYGHL